MQDEVGADLFAGVDDFPDCVGTDAVAHPGGGGDDDIFDIEFVGVDEEADHGHLIVRFVRDIADDEDAVLCDPGIGLGGAQSCCAGGWRGWLARVAALHVGSPQ